MDDATDSARRDALARSLCARICDERRGLDVLESVDRFLAYLEHHADEDEQPTLLFQLHNDRYNEDEGHDLDRAHRRGWNAAMQHATALVRAHLGRKASEPEPLPAPRCDNCAPEWSCFDGSGQCSKRPLTDANIRCALSTTRVADFDTSDEEPTR